MSGQNKTDAFNRYRLKCVFLSLLLAVVFAQAATAQTIAPPNSVFKAGRVYGLASGAANVGTGNAAGGYFGNGSGAVFDVSITNSTGAGNQLFVLQGNGDGSFSLQPSGIYNFGTAVQDGLNLIVAGPVVSPTSSDLVVTDDRGSLYLLKGNGDGTFQAPLSLNQVTNTLSSYLNSSGTLNLVISTASVTVLVNSGSGNFTPTVVPVPARSSPNVTSAIALNAGGVTAVLQLYSDGTAGLSQQVNGIFQPPVLLGALGIPSGSAVESQSLSVFIFNGQPYLTGIVNTPTGALTSVGSAYVWPFGVVSGATGISATPSIYSIPTNDAVYVTTADVDGDGIPDLIVLGGGQFSVKQTINLFLSGSPNGFAPPEIGTVGTPNEILGPGEYGIEVLVADVNGDGKNDLLLYEPSQGLTVLLNQGSGVFLTPTTYAAGNTPRSIAKADFNGDGIDDLVVANGLNSANNTSDNTISVFVSKAAGSYASQVTYPTGTHPIAVTTGKVNGNQSVFVLSAADTTGNFSNPVVGFLQANGDGTFQPPVNFSTGTNVAQGAQPLAIAAGSFDASGNSTLAVGNSDGTINLFTYQAGAFVEGSTLNATSAAPAYGLSLSSLAVADMNGDGNLDLVATLRGQCGGFDPISGSETLIGGAVLIFPGNGAGAFQSPVAVTTNQATFDPASVSLGSLVNVTRIDMLVTDAKASGAPCSVGGIALPNPIVFTNGGNLTFTETDLPAQFGGVSSLPEAAIADVNGDGSNDLIFSQNGLVSALLNSGTGTFTSTPTIYVGSSSSAGLVTGSFFGSGGHDAALTSASGVALLQIVLTSPRPIITSVTPGSGSTAGGETVIIAGQNFQNGAAVSFARTPATSVTVISATSLSVVAPAIPAGAVDVQVINPDGQTAVLPGGFLGVAPAPRPIITSVTPGSGPTAGGETVIIAGQNFQNGAAVSFARTPATSVTVISATSLSVGAPAIPAGAVDVQVINPDGQTAVLPGGFLGVAPAPPPVSVMVSETITVTDTPFVATPYTVTGIAAPVANYSAGSLGFVGVTTGQTVTQTLTVANIGLQPLVISSEAITQDSSNSFSVTQVLCSDGTRSIAETIVSGGECTLTISYTAPASGTPSGSITFTDNAGLSNLTSIASGSSFGQSLVLSSTVATTAAPAEPPTTIPINITESITVKDTVTVPPPYTETGIVAPVANYSAGSLGFLGVMAGQTATQTLTVSSVGLQPLTISAEAITQDASNSFTVTQVLCSDGTTSITETILSGGECTLTISYTAPASGTPTGAITFTDNAGLSNLTSAASGSSFTQTLALSSTVATTPAPAEPPTTIPINITETITVNDQVSSTLIQISQMSQTITFGPPPSVLVGSKGTVSASASSGLPVIFGSTTPGICAVNGNVVTGVGVGQCVVTANQVGNTQYLSAPQVLQTVPIGSTQAISFSPTALPFGGTATLVATASSGLPVSFGLSSGNCTVSGDTISTPGGGVCVVVAIQLGNVEYLPAPNVTQTIRIERPQAITFTSFPASLAIGASAAFTATSSAGLTGTGGLTGLPVTVTSTTPNICTVSGSTVTGVGAGTCVLAGNQAGGTGTSGGAPFEAAPQVTVTIPVGASQRITFGAAPAPIPTGSTGTTSATASSGLPVFYGTTTPGNCMIGLAINGVVNVTGVTAGGCVVTANQPGNATYAPAPQVTQTVPIGSTQAISFSPAALPFGGAVTLVATASSGLPVSFGLSSGNCTISGDTISTPGGGVCVAFAFQLGNAQYLPATPVSQTIRIERPQAITFTSFPASLAIGASAAFTATSSAGLTGTGGLTGLPVTVTSTTPNICTVSGSMVTGVGAGTCVLAGNQAGGTGTSGGAPFEAAPQVTVTIPVGASQRITFGAAPAPIPTGSTGTTSATASSGLPVFYGTTTPGNCMIGLAINGVVNVTGVTAGGCVVTANQPGNATYAPAPQVTQTVTIGTTQTITFTPTILLHGGTATLEATATSGLPVSFFVLIGTSSNCTVSGTTVSTPSGGNCVVVASQSGNAQYLPAPNVTQTIRIERPQAITFTSFPASLAIGASAAFTATSSAGLTGTGGLTGLPVTVTSTTPNICTVSGSTVTGVGAGTCVLAGNQAGGTGTSGGAPFEAAPQVTVTIPVGASQRITFGAAPAPIPTGSTGTTSATASSGLPVFYGTTTPGNCMIGLAINGVVNVTGVTAGGCVVTANQPGNATYAPAPQVTQTVTIGTTQTITFTPTILLHGGTATLEATATSGLPVSFFVLIGTSSNCTVSGTTVSTPSGGNCVVVASQSGNAQYLPAPNVTQTIRIEQNQTITFSTFPASLEDSASGVLGAASSRGLPVNFSSLSPSICTVIGNTVTGVSAGSCVVAANAAAGVSSGGVVIEPAPQVTETIPVGSNQTITFGAAPLVLVGGTGTVSATASSGLPVSFGSLTPGICTVSGYVVTGVSFGACIVTANQGGNAQYLPARQVTQTITD